MIYIKTFPRLFIVYIIWLLMVNYERLKIMYNWESLLAGKMYRRSMPLTFKGWLNNIAGLNIVKEDQFKESVNESYEGARLKQAKQRVKLLDEKTRGLKPPTQNTTKRRKNGRRSKRS